MDSSEIDRVGPCPAAAAGDELLAWSDDAARQNAANALRCIADRLQDRELDHRTVLASFHLPHHHGAFLLTVVLPDELVI